MKHAQPEVRLSRLTVAALVVLGTVVVAEQGVRGKQDVLRQRAAQVMEQALVQLKDARITGGLPFSSDDVAETGIIGEELTPLVTTLGSLAAKRMSLDPGLASLAVDLLRAVGVKEGDVIAAGFSGSLPGLNIAVLSAAHALKLDTIIISSVGASQWGATEPQFTWLDMERVLFDRGVVRFRSAAAARSGGAKTNFLLEEGNELAAQAIRRNGLPELAGKTFSEVVQRRLAVYLEGARGRPIRAFVNVGGGAANLGRCDQSRIAPGIVRRLPACNTGNEGLVHEFARMGVPIIHLLQVQRLVRQHGLTLQRPAGGLSERRQNCPAGAVGCP